MSLNTHDILKKHSLDLEVNQAIFPLKKNIERNLLIGNYDQYVRFFDMEIEDQSRK